MIRRILIAVLLVGAIACGVLALTAPDDTAEAQATPASLSTAGWSARRVPQPFVDAVGATHLQSALDTAVNGSGSVNWAAAAVSATPSATAPTLRGVESDRWAVEAARIVPVVMSRGF